LQEGETGTEGGYKKVGDCPKTMTGEQITTTCGTTWPDEVLGETGKKGGRERGEVVKGGKN